MRSGVRWKTSAFYGRAVPEIKWKKRNKQKKRNPANLKIKRRRKLVSRCRQNGERKNSNTITDHGRTSAKKKFTSDDRVPTFLYDRIVTTITDSDYFRNMRLCYIFI